MFDWNGEELANIIWGKESENEDHIVPYPDETYEKPPELDLSPFNATKKDLEHTDEKAQVDNGSQNVHNQLEDVDYGWANVGSFDDLDRILSNNDLVYENTNLLSIESPNLHLGDSSSDCEHYETKSGFTKDINTNLEKMECSGGKNEKLASKIVRRIPPLVYPIGAVNVAMPGEAGIGIGKMGEQRRSFGCKNTKGQKCDPWFSLGNQGKEFERRYTQHRKISSSKARNQENESSPYKQLINPLHSPCGYDVTESQKLHNCEEQSSGSSSLKPVNMTPQEKIEKLRRRQQMRALLAIHKQQQEFRHQPSCDNFSNIPGCSNEDQIGGSMSTLVSVEKSDLDTRPMMMKTKMNTNSLEDTALHQLENVISTLDIQIRVCIRDSLFRLAQSASQRRCASDTVCTKERLGCTKSSARTPVGETKTNPIDRAVAHLLFYRPPDLCGELLQSLESPSSGSTVANEGSSRGLALP